MNILELSELLQVQIIATYYPTWSPGGWGASFDRCEVASEPRGMLESSYGRGETPEAAIRDYVRIIQGRTLIFDSMTPDSRREIVAPKSLAYLYGEPSLKS